MYSVIVDVINFRKEQNTMGDFSAQFEELFMKLVAFIDEILAKFVGVLKKDIEESVK